jgi:hypothetical protein
MSYEATIASAGGDEATLAKSLIISIKDVTTNCTLGFHQDASTLGNN